MDCILTIEEEMDQALSKNYFANISSSQEAAINAGTSPPCTESVVPNLRQDQTELELLQAHIARARTRAPAPLIQSTPIDEVSWSSWLFAMAFPLLFPTGASNPNEGHIQSVKLADWGTHMLQFYDGHFGCHPWFQFLLFNLLLREKARKLAHYFVKKNSFLNDLSLEHLEQQLHNDDSTLNNIVHQGSSLNGTWPFWHIKGSQLLAQACCLPHLSPIFVTFSCADHQWEDLQHHLPTLIDGSMVQMLKERSWHGRIYKTTRISLLHG